MRGRNGLRSSPGGLFCHGLRSPRGGPPGGLLLHGRSPCGFPRGLSCHGRSPRGSLPGGLLLHGLRSRGPAGLKPCAARDLLGGFPVDGRVSPPAGLLLHPPPLVRGSDELRRGSRELDEAGPGLLLHGRSPRGASPDGLLLHGFRWARGPVGLVCHGRSLGGAPPPGLSFHGLRSRGLAGLNPPPPLARLSGELRRGSPEPCEGGCATSDLSGGFPVHGRLPLPPGLLLHPPPLVRGSDERWRGSRGLVEGGLLLHGRSPRGGPSLSRSRCVAGSFSDHARSGRFFFLNRSRGSLCAPPGRQSLPRRSAPPGRSAWRSRGTAAACLRI